MVIALDLIPHDIPLKSPQFIPSLWFNSNDFKPSDNPFDIFHLTEYINPQLLFNYLRNDHILNPDNEQSVADKIFYLIKDNLVRYNYKKWSYIFETESNKLHITERQVFHRFDDKHYTFEVKCTFDEKIDYEFYMLKRHIKEFLDNYLIN